MPGIWIVTCLRQEPIEHVTFQPVARQKGRIEMVKHVEITRPPIVVRFVIQHCDSEEYARKLAGAMFGTMPHSILFAKEAKEPMDIIRAWKDGATLL